MDTNDRVIALLESIDASLRELAQRRRASAPKQIADDRDLDGRYGDPVLKFDPRDWTGPSYKNRAFSECPPELLDIVAETYDWFAQQAEQKNERTEKGKPVAEFKRADAARARGWAKRMRDGKHRQPPPPVAASSPGWSDEEGAGSLTSDEVRW